MGDMEPEKGRSPEPEAQPDPMLPGVRTGGFGNQLSQDLGKEPGESIDEGARPEGDEPVLPVASPDATESVPMDRDAA
jgi:hypothetical protein